MITINNGRLHVWQVRTFIYKKKKGRGIETLSENIKMQTIFNTYIQHTNACINLVENIAICSEFN